MVNKKFKGVNTMGNFLKNAFKDMKESAKAQHEVDKVNFALFGAVLMMM